MHKTQILPPKLFNRFTWIVSVTPRGSTKNLVRPQYIIQTYTKEVYSPPCLSHLNLNSGTAAKLSDQTSVKQNL